MGLFKTIVISAAVYGAYKFFTETDEFGKSRIEEIRERVPELVGKARALKEELSDGSITDGY